MEDKKRYINVLKGVAIFLVTWGHCIQHGAGSGYTDLYPPEIHDGITKYLKKLDKLGIGIIVLQWPCWFLLNRIPSLSEFNLMVQLSIYIVFPYLIAVIFYKVIETPGVKLCEKLFDKMITIKNTHLSNR